MNKENSSKKESVSVLEKIRRRTGLLVGIVGLALIIFILESLLGSGATIFGGDELTSIGSVNGKKIDRNDFMMQLENRLNQYRQRNQSADVDDQVRAQAIDGIIQQYVLEHAIMPQFHKAGITVSEDELYEKVVIDPDPTIVQNLTDPNTGKVNEQFARPDGSLDPVKWRQAVQNVSGESEMAVRQMEQMVQTNLYYQKFRALVNKGLYVTKAEAKRIAEDRNSSYQISFVQKPYASISDSSVKVGRDEMEKFYKEHKYLYKNPENSRKLEYVTFDVIPSKEDVAEVEKSAIAAAEQLKGKSLSEDSLILAQESENGNIMIQDFNKKTMIVRDSSIFTAAVGTVFGPYNEGAYYKVYKLQGVNNIADSARVRHILVALNDAQTQQPKRSKAQAKREADSVLVLLKDKKVSFDSLVMTYSDDMGSRTNGGDYGWFDENEQFVEPFKNAGLKGTKGNMSVVETEFGYHIIEVLDVSANHHKSWRVAQVFKPILASDETNQAAFAKANQFGGENNSSEQFDKAAESQKLTRRRADNVREGDYQLPGLDGAKEIVKWAFTAEKGDVSVFTVPGKHVVAKLSGIKEKGVLPMEEVEEEVMDGARRQKKQDMLLEQFKAGGEDLNALAKKLGVEVVSQDGFDLDAGNFNMVGADAIMAGTVAGTGKGKTSRAVAGAMGVFKVAVNDITQKSQMSPEELRKEAYQMISGRTYYEVYNAIKDLAEIDIHKTRID